MSKKNVASSAPVAAPKAVVKKKVRVVTPEAGKAEATSTPKTADKPAEKKAASKATKYLSAGEFLGRRMRVAEYQDYTFSINDQPTRRLTDEELCADWQKAFPNAVKFEVFHVRGARRDFNSGLHSKAFSGKHESVPYIKGPDGKPVRSPYTRATAVKTAPAQPGSPAPKASDAARSAGAKKAAAVAVKRVVKKTAAAA